MYCRKILSKTFLLAAFTSLAITGTRAATFTWDDAIWINGETDIKTAGVTIDAMGYDSVAGSVTANGVTFTLRTTAAGGGRFSVNGMPNLDTGYKPSAPPYTLALPGGGTVSSSDYPNYFNLIDAGVYGGSGSTATVTLQSLTVGHIYLTQVWGHDPRVYGAGANRIDTISSASIYSGSKTLDLNSVDASPYNGVGQHISGTFTADTTSAAFTVQSPGPPQLNAIQLRDITNIAYWTGTAGNVWDAAVTDNFASNAYGDGFSRTFFNTAAATINSARFADTYWDGGAQIAVTQTTVNLSGNVSVATGTIYFSNSVIDYTVQGSGSITGSTRLVKEGTGKLTIRTSNTYTNITVIGAGTLITGNTRALGNSTVYVKNGGTLQIGDGTVNTVTLASGANLVLEAAGASLKLNGINSQITLQGSGGYQLASGMILDLNNAFNTAGNYTLITGGSGTKTLGTYTITNLGAGFNAALSNSGGNLMLAVTAVPEPAACGLLGAGALAAVSCVRRRMKAGARRVA